MQIDQMKVLSRVGQPLLSQSSSGVELIDSLPESSLFLTFEVSI